MSDRECAADATAKESLAQTRKIPYNKAVLDEQIEEERRLFYVAMTRAKEKLYLLYPKQRYNKDTTRSRFIEELLTARYPLLRTDLHTP